MAGRNEEYKQGDRVYHTRYFIEGTVVAEDHYEDIYIIGQDGPVGKQLIDRRLMVNWDLPLPDNSINDTLDLVEDDVSYLDFEYYIKKANVKLNKV